MFTHEVGDAIARYAFGNVVVAFTHDMLARNPHYGTGGDVFSGIERMGGDGTTSDGCGWLGDYDTLTEALDAPEYYGYDDENAVRSELDSYAYFELRARNEYGEPVFRIAIYKPYATEVTGYDGGEWRKFAQGIVDAYAQWAENRVYTVGVADYTSGEVDYLGDIHDEPSEELARELAKELCYRVTA